MRLKIVNFFLLVLTLLLVSLLWFLFSISQELRELRDTRLEARFQQNAEAVTSCAASHAVANSSLSEAAIPNNSKQLTDEFYRMTQPKEPSLWRKLMISKKNFSLIQSVCHTPKCLKLSETLFLGNNSADRVPRIRHILWKSDRVSSYMAEQLKTWSAIHPNWTYVLWRDSDLERFVAKHYTGVLGKFKSLGVHIMRIDMIRHLILHKFGGVYADLDYVLLRPLDRFLKFPAVVTRETEAHAFFHFGMGTYPPSLLANPAFMMSEPGHPFYLFAIMHLNCRGAGHFNHFAGPPALSDLLSQYAKEFPLSENPDGVVIVPASRNFYGFDNNNFASSTSTYKGAIIGRLNSLCNELKKPVPAETKKTMETKTTPSGHAIKLKNALLVSMNKDMQISEPSTFSAAKGVKTATTSQLYFIVDETIRTKLTTPTSSSPVSTKQGLLTIKPHSHTKENEAKVQYKPNVPKELIAYCTDVSNLDPITDRRELAYAVHDYNKSRSSYDPAGSAAFDDKLVDIRSILGNLLMAESLF